MLLICCKWIVANIFRWSGAYYLSRCIRIRLLKLPFVGILGYHHIGKIRLSLSPFAVPPERFERHIAHFSQNFNVIGMNEVAELFRKKRLLRDAMVFSFDDGYFDNAVYAAPALKKAGLTGVFYLTGQSLANEPLLWNDRLACLLESLTEVPSGVLETLSPLLRELIKSKGDRRIAKTRQVFMCFRDMPKEERNRLLEELSAFSKSYERGVSNPRALMGTAEIKFLVECGHEIGAHTLTHERLSEKKGESEAIQSVVLFRAHGYAIDSFAYPFGKPDDINVEIPKALRRSGIATAVTTVEGVVSVSKADPLFLPRMLVAPWHSVEFLLLRFEWFAWKSIIAGLFYSR